MHQPLVQVPTSTIVPLGMSVMISLSVPGLFRRLTSEVTVAGLAAARSADSDVSTAVLTASRAKFMACLPPRERAPLGPLTEVPAAIQSIIFGDWAEASRARYTSWLRGAEASPSSASRMALAAALRAARAGG